MLRKDDGMTLVETVLYLALFAVIFMSVMQFVLSIAESNRVAKGRNQVEKSSMFIMQHLKESFGAATGVDGVNSVFDADSGILKLNTTSGQLVYQIVDERLMFESGGSSVPISNPDMIINRFYLQEILDASSSLVGVRITLVVISEKDNSIETLTTAYMH